MNDSRFRLNTRRPTGDVRIEPRLVRAAFGALGALIAIACAGPLHAEPIPGAIARKLDARLLAKTLGAPEQAVSAWVCFADKGERDPVELARMIAAAERALTPRCRARRLRNLVTPLADGLDVPVSPDYIRQLEAAGLQPFAVSRWFNRAAVRVPAGELPRIARFRFVSSLKPVERMRVSHDPEPVEQAGGSSGALPTLSQAPELATSVSYGVKLKELQQLNLPAVHDSGYTGNGVLICMLDDGFYHQDFHRATRVINVPPGFRRDFVDGDTLVTDASNGAHGMATLSCIGGNLPGNYVGAAFGATFALARTEVDATETPQEMFNWQRGAEWADSLGADIISSSLGYFTFDGGVGNYTYADLNGHTTVVSKAAEIAASKGILVVNAAGNSGPSAQTIIAPADVNGDSLVAAGGVDSLGVIVSFSSRGPTADGRIKPDLCARALFNWLPSTTTDSTYGQANGTSFACPLLAGVCACIMSARPTWPAVTVIRALRETASRFTTPDNTYGYGIVNALAALQWTPPTTDVPYVPVAGIGIALLGANPIRVDGRGARVRFGLGPGTARESRASVRVLDVSGRFVRTIWSGALLGDSLEAGWDGRDAAGRRVQPGVYWIALVAGSRRATVKVVAL